MPSQNTKYLYTSTEYYTSPLTVRLNQLTYKDKEQFQNKKIHLVYVRPQLQILRAIELPNGRLLLTSEQIFKREHIF